MTIGPMNLDRDYDTLFRISGVATDADRLYVVWFHEEKAQIAVAAKQPFDGNGTYRLVVFRLSNGELLHDLEMRDGDFPMGLPDESRDAGPLILTASGVACCGVTFDYDGAELVKQHYDGNKP